MVQTCVDDVLKLLPCLVYTEFPDPWRSQLEEYQVKLRFIEMFLWCLVSWDSDADLRSISASIQSIWGNDGSSRPETSSRERSEDWERLEEKICRSKRLIKKHSESLILKSLKCETLTSREIQQFLHVILINIDYLLTCFPERGLLVKNQIESLKEKLLIFVNLVQFTAVQCLNCKAVEDFNIHVLTWSNKAACLMLLYFIEDFVPGREFEKRRIIFVPDHQLENSANVRVTDLLLKANPRTPEFIAMCFAVVTSTKFSGLVIPLLLEFVSSFIDLLFKDLMFISRDDFGKLREGLIYLFFYLAGPLATSSDNPELILIQRQIDAVLAKASHLICLFGEAKVHASAPDIVVEILNMIDQVKGKFEDQYFLNIPHSSWSNFPRTSGLGFVESLLRYLVDIVEGMTDNQILPLSLKQQIFTLMEELASLRPYLQDILGLLNEQKEMKDLWEEIISVAHQVELSIKQSFFVYHPLCLSSVLLKIQDIKPKAMRVKRNDIYTTGVVSTLMSSSYEVRKSVPFLRIDEELVGFEKEIRVLVDQLTRGTANLDVVAIVGMGGIGKTTLAMKIFNEKPVMYHFHVQAFCSVSQVYRRKKMLREILSHLIANEEELRNMTEEDLAYRLYKCLKGRKYLIVLDDIWNISAWNDLKNSLPDDGVGSRVVFTTRIIEIPLLAKTNCIPHMLRFLTFDESWELLQRKIFHKDPCPLDLSEVGRLIANNCKGLPLTVVVVAGLLAKAQRSMSWWEEVAGHLNSFVFDEGCRDVLELSYMHLSEALKSCLLYLGAFPEDTKFKARDVTKLWAAEGFILTSERSRVHKVAKEYLNYLGDRSLIIVDKRSLAGNIKCFRLHDLIQDFCITKAKEQHFVSQVNAQDVNISTPLIHDGHRICIQGKWRSFLDANLRGPKVHSLLCFDDNDHKFMDAYLMSSLFRNFKLLQVLHLPFVPMLDFPTELMILVHLRYLQVYLNPEVSPVRLTISNLWNLETLVIGGFGDVDLNLEDKIWKMRRLRHLEFTRSSRVTLHDDISQLLDLETFGWATIPEGKKGEELFMMLPNLRKLRCFCHPSTKLEILTKLESFDISALSRNFYPSAFSFPSTLRKLTLRYFQLSGTELSNMIEKLTCLQVLKLKRCKFTGNRWEVHDEEFPHLKSLKLSKSDIQYWNATTDSLCCLEKLVLKKCYKLVGIPLCFGEVLTLRALEVMYCNEDVEKSAIQIQKDQLDMGNDTLEVVIRSDSMNM